MARSTLSLLFLFGLVCLASAQTNSTITEVDDDVDELPAANTTDTTANTTTEAACPLTEASLAGVDLANATTACLDSTSEGFCSACLCSIATALVAGSPTFSALAASPNATDINLNALVEQCAGTLGPALLTALSTESLTALAACDLNAAALTCGGNTTDDKEVISAQGPATSVAAPTPVPARSGAGGIVAAALFAVPVAAAVALAFITY